MSDIQLNIGDLWEIAGERHFLDQLMGSGFLLFRSERTGAPFQIPLDNGEHVSPTLDWLKAQFAQGAVRRLDRGGAPSRAQRIAAEREDDFDTIQARDPKALVRQVVLKSLDRMGNVSRSDQGLRKALGMIWEAKPRHLAGVKPPSPSTVRRWLKLRGDVGERVLKIMVSMSGRVPRRKRLPLSVWRRMHEEAMSFWADHKKTIGDAYDDLCEYLAGLNAWLKSRRWRCVPIPSKETFRQHVRATESYETVAAKYGKKEADQRFKACRPGLVSHRPLLLAAMDHTRADYFVALNVGGWRLLGRPWLTVLIDIHSRCVVGWVLTFEPPSLYSVTECIKRANRPKPYMRDRFPDCPELADIFGKFDEIVVDNGWEFTGTSFESAMTNIGASVRWAPVRSPTYKAVVERFFGTLNTLLHRKLPGGTFSIDQLRAWELDPRRDAVLSLEQAEELLISAIGVYHQELHTTLGDAPVHVWSRGVRERGVQVIGDDRQLDKMVGAHEERTLTRSGVSLFGIQYHDPAITGPLLEQLASREPVRGRRKGSAEAKVTVKYNPANLGEVHIWNHRRGVFETLPSIDPDYAQGLSKWQHERLQEWGREDTDKSAEARRKRRLELRREIEKLTPDRVLTRNKRAQARLLSSPRVEALAGDHIRIAYAEPRHDGMAPVIPTALLAPERTDGHAKPVRSSGGEAAGRPSRSKAQPSKLPTAVEWPAVKDDDTQWEEFQ